MSLQRILSGGDSPKKGYDPKELKQLILHWNALYSEKLDLPHKVGVGEKAALKKVLQEYGLETVKTAITYFLENFETLDFLKGYPSIYAFVGFKRTLIPLAVKGAPTKGDTPQSVEDEEKFWRT